MFGLIEHSGKIIMLTEHSVLSLPKTNAAFDDAPTAVTGIAAVAAAAADDDNDINGDDSARGNASVFPCVPIGGMVTRALGGWSWCLCPCCHFRPKPVDAICSTIFNAFKIQHDDA